MESRTNQARVRLHELVDRSRLAWDLPAVRALCVVLGIGVAFAVVLAWRSHPVSEPVASTIVQHGVPLGSSDTLGAGPPARGSPSSASVAPDVVVDVVGPVRKPGVVRLPRGSRVADAIAAVGGLARGKTAINLARVLVDGEQIDVAAGPSRATAGAAGTPLGGGASAGAADGMKVNINQATIAQLEELPRIGPVTAQKIIDFRTQHGGFRSIEQLQEVPGIGAVTFAGLSSLVQV